MPDDIIAVVDTGSDTTATVENTETTTTVASTSNVATNTIEAMGDVDLQNLQQGAVLVYKVNTSKWTATTTLEEQNLEGGYF